MTYVKLYRNSITEYLSFCNLLFLLDIVKLIQDDMLGDAADACIYPLGPCLISATDTVGSSVPAQISSPGPPTYASTRLFFSLFAPNPTPQSWHAMGTPPGSSKEFMSPS